MTGVQEYRLMLHLNYKLNLALIDLNAGVEFVPTSDPDKATGFVIYEMKKHGPIK